jgi:hypothetical protein
MDFANGEVHFDAARDHLSRMLKPHSRNAT